MRRGAHKSQRQRVFPLRGNKGMMAEPHDCLRQPEGHAVISRLRPGAQRQRVSDHQRDVCLMYIYDLGVLAYGLNFISLILILIQY